MCPNNETLLLFSSDYRPIYLLDVHNVLAYPSGMVLHHRYDRRWVQPDIKPESIINKDALIICVTYKNNDEEMTFYPLRKCTITNAYIDGFSMYIYFELSKDWVDYSNNLDHYNQIIKKIKNRPIEKREGFYVSITDQLNFSFSESTTAWEKIIRVLVNDEKFANSIFLRIDGLFQYTPFHLRNSNKLIKLRTFNHIQKGYVIESDKNYYLRILFHFAKEPPSIAQDNAYVFEGNQAYDISPKSIDLLFRYDLRQFILYPKRTFASQYDYIKARIKNEILGPKIEIPLKITAGRTGYFALGLISLGLFFLSGIIGNLCNLDDLYSSIIQVFGVLLSSVGTWFTYGYKK